jgi:hypothetical protein
VVLRALTRRAAVVLALTLPAASLVLAAGLPQASACGLSTKPTNEHCYAEAENLHVAANHGVTGDLYITCLYYPDNGNFVTDEVWDANLANQTWIEAGIQSGVGYNGGYFNKDWFWALQPPGSNYVEYDTSVQANLTTEYPVEITYAGSDSWDVYGYDNFSEIGEAANNSYTPTQALGGTEYTSGSGSGLRDIANIYNLANQGLNGTWYSLGSAASNENLGPGNYIGGNYNSVASEESWSGPC